MDEKPLEGQNTNIEITQKSDIVINISEDKDKVFKDKMSKDKVSKDKVPLYIKKQRKRQKKLDKKHPRGCKCDHH